MAATSTDDASPKLKILMLHGFTQSATLFHAKTRALEKALHKAFPAFSNNKPLPGSLPSRPGGVELIYLTGPHHLRASDIPGYNPHFDVDEEETDQYAWWRWDERTGEYKGIEAGLQVVADAMKRAGRIDGVIGFSQGACATGMVAALLEKGRVEGFQKANGMPFPSSFGTEKDRVNPPLKFAVPYSGFAAPDSQYRGFYEPKLSTPVLHVIGSLDSVVDEAKSMTLVEACKDQRVAYHPGGHFVPIGKEMVGALIGFIRETCSDEQKMEKNVDDMDVPF